MATTVVVPPQTDPAVHAAPAEEPTTQNALVQAGSGVPNEGLQPDSPVLASLPVEVEVGVPIRDFRVRNLLSLEPGILVEARWDHLEDVPLAAGKVQLAWSEFEVLDAQMAVRVTRLV